MWYLLHFLFFKKGFAPSSRSDQQSTGLAQVLSRILSRLFRRGNH